MWLRLQLKTYLADGASRLAESCTISVGKIGIFDVELHPFVRVAPAISMTSRVTLCHKRFCSMARGTRSAAGRWAGLSH
jgi:hypothetical protein